MATTPSTDKKKTSSSAAKPTAGAKPAVKKPVAAKVAAPKKAVAAAPKKPVAPTKSAAPKKPAAKSATAAKSTVTPEQRYCMVAEAAYYHAERQGFMGDPVQNWIAAEAEIAAILSKKK
jgi:hypothetical protein